MKRSDVNQYIDYAMKFMAENKFCLPLGLLDTFRLGANEGPV